VGKAKNILQMCVLVGTYIYAQNTEFKLHPNMLNFCAKYQLVFVTQYTFLYI
jgi:hypothetical protein